MTDKKGMSMALTLVVSAVVLIVISLVIITIVTGGLSGFGGHQTQQMEDTTNATASAVELAYCNAQKSVSLEMCCLATYDGRTCEVILGGTDPCGGSC